MFLVKKRRLADAQYWTVTLWTLQKQPPKEFYRKKLFSKILEQHLRLESPYHQLRDLQACNFLKKKLQRRCFPVAKLLQSTCFDEHLRAANFELILHSECLDCLFQNHPDSVILQKYQSLSNQTFKHNLHICRLYI